MSFLDISEEIRQLGAQAEKAVRPYFDAIDEISEYNTEKVLAAFAKNRVAEAMFAGTTGYGYDDKGRDTLDQIYADIFGTEAALVRIGFVNGTHALCCAMYSAVKTGDVVLSATGPAYDTLMNTITGDMAGSMKQYGIGYRQVEMKNGLPDVPAIAEAAKAEDVKLVFIQRSKRARCAMLSPTTVSGAKQSLMSPAVSPRWHFSLCCLPWRLLSVWASRPLPRARLSSSSC